jgi:hypothetical protein
MSVKADFSPVVATLWPPFNQSAKAAALDVLTNNTSAALRELAPDTGSYLNEVFSHPPFPRFICVLTSISWQTLMSQIFNKHSGEATTHAFLPSSELLTQKMCFGVRAALEASDGR